MEKDSTESGKAKLYIDNHIIGGRIVRRETNGNILFEINHPGPLSTAEMGKRGEIFFEEDGRRCFVSGRAFFQPPSKVMLKSETGTEIEKRQGLRLETPSLAAVVSYRHGILHKTHRIKSTVIDISMRGAKIETSEPVGGNYHYEIQTLLPYRHSSLEFRAFFRAKHCRNYRDIFISGIEFTEIELYFENNLKKYIFGTGAKEIF